jgi:hypothetical protein
MAIKTMSASSGGGSKYSEGWHDATITKAEYNEWNDKKYLEIWFDGYGEYQTMRVYEMFSKEDNQEFAIARIFKHAQAGIMSVLDDPTGKRPIIQYDDEAQGLVGKTLSIYLHPDHKNPKYNRIFSDCAPMPGKYEHMSFTEEAVNGIKAGVERRYAKYKEKAMSKMTVSSSDNDTLGAEIPF